MIDINTEGVFPLGLAPLWKLLGFHMDEATLRVIHPWITSGTVSEDTGAVVYGGVSFPETRIADRTMRIAGRTMTARWEYRLRPPQKYAYSIRGVDGSLVTIDNAYEEGPDGTIVATTVQGQLRRVPGFLGNAIIRRLLSRADQEDLEFFSRLPRPPKGT